MNFNPRDKSISRKQYEADCESPGAIGLILQMLMPCLLFQVEKSCTLSILGGTHVGMSPTVFAVEHVLLPTLKQMGVNINLKAVKHGYFPDVVGRVNATIDSINEPLQAITLLERGGTKLDKIVIYVKASADITRGNRADIERKC